MENAKTKTLYHLLQEGRVSFLTWWAGIFEPVFNNLKNM